MMMTTTGKMSHSSLHFDIDSAEQIMACCLVNARTSRYLPKELASKTENYDTEHFHYDVATDSVDCKLSLINPYRHHFQRLYPSTIAEDELTSEMIEVLKTYTDSRSNECYMRTNMNLLSANFDQIDWTYVNQLRSLIRGLHQSNIKHVYYRGLVLSEREIQYYIDRRSSFYYTNSFLSFTTDRVLIYTGNAILILRTDQCSETAKANLANIWKWSTFRDEKEALLAVGTKLKVLTVRYLGNKWEIEVELMDDTVD